MLKKILPLILLSSIFLIGCTKQENKENKVENNTTTVQSPTSSPTPNENIVLVEKSTSYSPYLNIGNLTFFPDKENNNKLSSVTKPKDTGYISAKDIKDIFDYSVESIASIGEYIYFPNGSDSNALYKLDYQRNEITKINNNSVYNITSNMKSLYYINKDDNNKIYTYNLETDTSSSLSDDSCGKFLINGDFILYQNTSDNSKLYSINSDGTNRKQLTNVSVDSFTVYNGQILYINSHDNNALYKLDPNSTSTNRVDLINGTNLKCFDNKLYFIDVNNNNLCSLSVDLSKNTATVSNVTTDSINNYFLTDNGIFLDKTIDVNKTYILK